jgi:hypothetical protein
MKRLLVLALATACLAAFIPQDLDAGVGIKGGFALTKFQMASADPLPFQWANLPSYAAGVYFNIGLGFFSFQPEILYTRTGGKYVMDEDRLEFRFDYLQVPVLLKINVVPAGPIRPFICGGGYGAYLIRAAGVMVVGGASVEEDIRDSFQVFDYGLVGALGLTFKLPGFGLTVEGRYNYGMRNLYVDPLEGESMKNSSMMALVGVSF